MTERSDKVLIEFLETSGDQQQCEAAISKALEQLKNTAAEEGLLLSLLKLIRKRGTDEQKRLILTRAEAWIEKHPHPAGVRAAFLALATEWGTEMQISAAINSSVSWLIEHPSNSEVLSRYITLVCHNKQKDEYERAFSFAKIWLEDHPNSHSSELLSGAGSVLYAMQRYLLAGRYFSDVVRLDPDGYGGYWELGRAYLAQGQRRAALLNFISARARLPRDASPQLKEELNQLIARAVGKPKHS